MNNKIIKFNAEEIPLLELVLDFFKANSIDEIFRVHSNSEINDKLYNLEKTTVFRSYYGKIIECLSSEFNTDDFYYQRIPAFRIHRVGDKTVHYHNDTMYGHGKDVINSWVPLCDTNKHNTLQLSDKQISLRMMEMFVEEKLTLSKANNIFRKGSKPFIVKYGEILLFETTTVHGSEVNKSKENRLSFDIRILPNSGDPGVKSVDDFYTHNLNIQKKKKNCFYYIYTKNPLMENCPHFVQREIINSYAKSNNFDAKTKEETEIYGVDHYPVLFNYLENGDFNDILITSVMCLPSNKELRNKILLLAEKNKISLHFCLENIVSMNSSIKNINDYYDVMLKADKLI